MNTCGVEGDTLEELLLLFPDNFCTDPNIIDLTQTESLQPLLAGELQITFVVITLSGSAPPPPQAYRDPVDDTSDGDYMLTVMQRLSAGDASCIDDAHQRAEQGGLGAMIHVYSRVTQKRVGNSSNQRRWPSRRRH